MSEQKLSNQDILGHGASVWHAKRKARQGQIQEITFDDKARRKYLTGFHKRKLARKHLAEEKWKERKRQEKIVERAERKEQLLNSARENFLAVERALGNEVDDNFDIMEQLKGKGKQKEQEDEVEFEDENIAATVTIVEEFDVDELTTGRKVPSSETSVSEGDDESGDESAPGDSRPKPVSKRPPDMAKEVLASKSKKKGFETKAEKMDRMRDEKKRLAKIAKERKERRMGKTKRRKDNGGRNRPSRNKK